MMMNRDERMACEGMRARNRVAAVLAHAGARLALLLAVAGLALHPLRAVDPTWIYAVEATATVSNDPPRITLTWVEDTTQGLNGYRPSYTVSRRTGQDAWSAPVSIPEGQSSYTDENVTPGVAYEYKIVRVFNDPAAPQANHTAYGYVLSGIDVPFPASRGKVILVVEQSAADALGDRIKRLRQDLVGDGWTTTQITVKGDDSPVQVREQIRAAYFADAEHAQALFLLGHVAVPRAGHYAPDGHEPRPMPCDAYYGDVDGNWVDADGDGVFDANVIASDVELEVGRVDFSAMDGAGTGLSEMELLARYLDKDHAFRIGDMRLGAKALIGDRVGVDRARAPAAAGYRMFSAFYGPEQVIAANIEDNASDGERWVSVLQRDAFGWAFGSGGGDFDTISYLGTEGDTKVATSANLASKPGAGFYLFFGSYFIEWQQPNNLMRAALASPSAGLGAAWSGRPSFFLHAMGLGETVGFGVRASQNNTADAYFAPTNAFSRAVHVAWMGDPTLRLQFPGPIRQLTGSHDAGGVTLNWQPPADASDADAGYMVYRAASPDGPYTSLTPTPVSGTSFVDTSAPGGATYLVRGVKRQETPSGRYLNPSEGLFWTDPAASTPATRPLTEPGTVRLSFPLLFVPSAADSEGPRAPGR